MTSEKISPELEASTLKPEGDTGVISLENLDKFLEENDPDFTMSLKEIVPEELKSDHPIETLVLDEKTLGEDEESKVSKNLESGDLESLNLENDETEIRQRWKRKIRIFLLRMKKIPHRLSTLKLKMSNEVMALVLGSWRILRHKIPQFFVSLSSSVVRMGQLIHQLFQYVKTQPWQQKIIFFIMALSFIGFTALISYNLKGRWWPSLFPDYVRDLSLVADHVEAYDVRDQISLNESFQQTEFTVLMDKMIVNLRRTPEHQNPMGAFVFYIKVDSKETAVEIKDRKIDLSDSIQRTLESLTYEELNGPGGKTQLKSLVRRAINQSVSQGKVRDVYIEMMITKP